MIHFFRNEAIVVGSLTLFASGVGGFSIDGWL